MTCSDAELLKAYAQDQSQEAFAELVRRYVNLVHAAAMRQVGDAHLAEDVTQAVFIVLAKKVTGVRAEYLPGWLLQTTRFCSADAVKSRRRRLHHEQRAAAMKNLSTPPTDSPAQEIAEYLDQALGRLNRRDSTALALRYLQDKSSADVAATLGVSQDAAQKIILRALPKLRRILVARGLVLSGTGGLAEFMIATSHHAAPPGFSAHISTANISIVKGAMKTMFWNKVKFAGAFAAAVLVVGGGAGMILTGSHWEKMTAIAAMTQPAKSQASNTGSVVLTFDNGDFKYIEPFESNFLQLMGCRIQQPVKVEIRSKPGAPAPVANEYEQEMLAISLLMEPEIARAAQRCIGTIVSSEDGSDAGKFELTSEIGKHWESGSEFNGVELKALFYHITPAPGDYLIKFSALDSNNKPIASAVVPLHVQPLPVTQIQICDVQPDGQIRFLSVMQGLNVTNSPQQSGAFMNSDFVNVEKLMDDAGNPIHFSIRHDHGHYIYHYQLPKPVRPGDAIMEASSGTMDGLITSVGDGLFQYSMNQSPSINQPVRRIELYRLPAEAKLISTVPANLPHRMDRMVGGRMQIYMETIIPPGGSNLVSFRYRMPR